MKVAVIGAGAAGVATAWTLGNDGHEVTVLEARGTVAEAGSFAAAGLIAPGWNADWTGAAGRWTPRWAALGAGLQVGSAWPRPGDWGWLWRHRGQRCPARALDLQTLNSALAAELNDALALEHDRTAGLLVLLRTGPSAAEAAPAVDALRQAGVTVRELTPDQARAIEPALCPDTPLHGALQLAGDAINGREWAICLRQRAQALGVRWRFGEPVRGLRQDGAGWTVDTPASPAEHFDAVIVCAGETAGALLKPLGLALPQRVVAAHSVSAAVREPLDAPLSAVIDARHGVSIARVGQRVRVAGGARLGGARCPRTLQRLYGVLTDWFPGAAKLSRGSGLQEWHGMQAWVPDGRPVIGGTRLPGLYLHAAGADAGWSTALAGARLLGEALAGRPAPIDPTPYAPARLGL